MTVTNTVTKPVTDPDPDAAPRFAFTPEARDGAARSGTLHTGRGNLATPCFMPVGTAASVKAMPPEWVRDCGAQIILANTYHLMLRPGAEAVAALGGLHRFMHWPGPILTDSGGYQVMSLSALRKITEDGVQFRSHIDGSAHLLTPERAIEIQHLLGSDITMAFDECTPWPVDRDQAAHSMALSMRWAARCRAAFRPRPGHGLFGIVQGSIYADLRRRSVTDLVSVGFDGYAVGGLAVGEGQDLMFRTLDATCPLLPTDRPRYLMGVGKPDDILGAVARGIDMFDCVLPTRSGRNGQAFTRRGPVNLKNARHRHDPRPLDAGCACPACRDYGRAYLHHLVRAGEILGAILLTRHNLTFYQDLMAGLRTAIRAGRLADFSHEFLAVYRGGDIPPPES